MPTVSSFRSSAPGGGDQVVRLVEGSRGLEAQPDVIVHVAEDEPYRRLPGIVARGLLHGTPSIVEQSLLEQHGRLHEPDGRPWIAVRGAIERRQSRANPSGVGIGDDLEARRLAAATRHLELPRVADT